MVSVRIRPQCRGISGTRRRQTDQRGRRWRKMNPAAGCTGIGLLAATAALDPRWRWLTTASTRSTGRPAPQTTGLARGGMQVRKTNM